MMGALVRLVIRGILLLLLVAGALSAYHLYRSGHLPLVERAIEDATVVGSVKAAIALHKDLSRRELHVSADEGTVKLSGRVQSLEEKEAASELASHVAGVENVENDLTVDPDERAEPSDREEKSLGKRLDDFALLAKIRAALHLDRELRKLELGVSVSAGTVSLSGSVPSEELRERILVRVESVEGVRNVDDRLAVSTEGS
ncbi:MAG TPA: BON domain-containing protein [Vicinamibacteria bacterium]|nr:BON domain-containing protein [Vicinamibacteria bacterium]